MTLDDRPTCSSRRKTHSFLILQPCNCLGHRDGLEFLLEQLRQQFRLFISTSVEEEVKAEERFDYHAFIARHFEVRPARASAAITVNDLARLSAELDRGEIDVILLTTNSMALQSSMNEKLDALQASAV